jgi:S1-C subfamily serine protease
MENGRQFDVTLYQRRVGTPVNLEVARGLQRRTIKIPVLERDDEIDRLRGMVTPEQNLISRLGILGLDLTPELARLIPNLRSPSGIVVAGVAMDAEASSGLLPGDVIYAVNGEPVRSLADLRNAITPIARAGTAVLHLGRQGQLRYLTVVLE